MEGGRLFVTACGHIWSSGKSRGAVHRKLNAAEWLGGYMAVQVCTNFKRRKYYLHRVVAEAFHGKPDGLQVRHLDGCKANNSASNLAWGTAIENASDRDAHGTTARNEMNGNYSVSDDRVAEAVQMVRDGVPQRKVAAAFGVSQSAVWRWAHGAQRRRADAGGPMDCDRMRAALDDAGPESLEALRRLGVNPDDIIREASRIREERARGAALVATMKAMKGPT